MTARAVVHLVAALSFLAASSAVSAQAVTPAEARAIAKEAYIYSYAMTESYQTWRTQAVDPKSSAYVGGFNVYRHYSEPFSPANKDIVTPNNDTPYSWAWLDLRAEPMVISVPAVPKDRYYVMQWIDIFTQNFAYIGVRSTGFGAGNYLIAGPRWKGETPPGIKKVFKAESEIVGTLTRTSLAGPGDVAAVKALQAQYKLQPLSTFLKQPAPPAPPAITFPRYNKAQARSHDFIGYLNFLLLFANPPHPSEVAIRKRFEKIGIVPGAPWDASKVAPETLAAIDAGVKDGQAEIDALAEKTFDTNGLFGSREQLKTSYTKRAVAAMKGLYGNSIEEAWYGGYLCDGSKPSTIHFTKENLPPAKFFWSATMYTIPDRFLYDNTLNRYSIGDRTQGLVYGPDGSLTIYVGNVSPGKDKESNWLPAPAARCSLVVRVYGPSEAARTGKWKLPPLQPVGATPSAAPAAAAKEPSAAEGRAIFKEAYIYGLPMVDQYKTIYAFSVDKGNPQYKGPFNTILNIARVFTPEDTAFVTPNSDTPYSFAILDLRAEPMVVTVPKIEKNRYFVFQLLDLYTFNFDYIGTRATGNDGGNYLITGPNWKAENLPGITKVIPAETQLVSLVGRTQLFNPADLENVKKVQAGYKVQPLSTFLGTPAPPPAPPVTWMKPLPPAEERTSPAFFDELAFLMQFAVPAHPSEVELRKRFASVGLIPGQRIDVASLSAETLAAVKGGMEDGQKAIDAKRATLGGRSDMLFGTRAFLKNDFVARATGTQVGIGANSREEAMYPIYDKDADGKPLDGNSRYTLRFAKGSLPPVNAFWSLTMYDKEKQLLVKNPINRYLINAPMLPELKRDADGGLTIYVQSDSPGKDKESNWLPAPKGPFMAAMRYYLPKPELLNGQWKSPPMQRAP